MQTKRVGLVLLLVGLAWDLVYHAALALVRSDLPPLLDLLGNLGHGVTLAGLVLVVLVLLREHPLR